MKQKQKVGFDAALIEHDKSRIIEMAWEDRTPFDAILMQRPLMRLSVCMVWMKAH